MYVVTQDAGVVSKGVLSGGFQSHYNKIAVFATIKSSIVIITFYLNTWNGSHDTDHTNSVKFNYFWKASTKFDADFNVNNEVCIIGYTFKQNIMG